VTTIALSRHVMSRTAVRAVKYLCLKMAGDTGLMGPNGVLPPYIHVPSQLHSNAVEAVFHKATSIFILQHFARTSWHCLGTFGVGT
jgi:hypothetical protein